MDREPSIAEHTGVLWNEGRVDCPLKNEPLGAVVSAGELHSPSVSPVASATHTTRQVRLRLGSKGSSRLSHVAKQQQDPLGQALAVATARQQQAVPVALQQQHRLPASPSQQQPLVAGIVWQHGALPTGVLVWLFWQQHLPALRRLFWGLST